MLIKQLHPHYLKIMGIDMWVRRHLPPPPVITESILTVMPEHSIPDKTNDSLLPIPTASTGVDWEILQEQVVNCTACALHQTRTQTVFGVGNRQSKWLFVGEAPGADEDAQGEPFVGRAGKLLNAMLQAIHLPRETIYIANVLKCRPPDNRNPAPQEMACCAHFLQQQIALLNPQIIVALGTIAAQHLLATDTPIGKLRGKCWTYGQIPLIATYHPAYLLRRATEKRKAWQDLQFACQVFAEQS